LNVFKRCDGKEVKDPKKRVLGKDSTQVGFSVEKDLVERIDQLARRDCISRSTWMREALIAAWREAREFKRTPLHGYLATPIEIQSARVAEEPEQTPKRRRKTG
jgi:metal-responsive CopG/Arc/MetJ family transcriptional regulator